MVADRGAIGCFVEKGGGTEMTDGTQNISGGVEEQEKVVREGDQVKKKAKGDLTTTDFAAGNRHFVT